MSGVRKEAHSKAFQARDGFSSKDPVPAANIHPTTSGGWISRWDHGEYLLDCFEHKATEVEDAR